MLTATPAQRALLHAGESALRSAGLTIAAGVYQYVVTNGLNIPGLLAFLGIAFVAQLAMIDKSIRANPQASQALSDTVLDLPQEIKELPGLVHMLHGKVDQVFATQHTHPTSLAAIGQAAPSSSVAATSMSGQPMQSLTLAAPAQPAQVPQQPFPPLNWTGITPAVPPQ